MILEEKTVSKKYAYETPFLLLSLAPHPASEKKKRNHMYTHRSRTGRINENILTVRGLWQLNFFFMQRILL